MIISGIIRTSPGNARPRFRRKRHPGPPRVPPCKLVQAWSMPTGKRVPRVRRKSPMLKPQERDLQNPVIPVFLLHHPAPGEEKQPDREHAVDSEQSAVGVVHGQIGSMLIIVDDRQVDQEAENPRPQEVPERGGHQEVKRPLVGKLLPLACGSIRIPACPGPPGRTAEPAPGKRRPLPRPSQKDGPPYQK